MQKQREHWASQLGFILSAAGSAIGLGTLWMFPYVTGENGGGLFVLFFIICTLFVGIPVFIAELVLGRRAQRAPVGIFLQLAKDNPFWKTAGWLGVLSSFLIMSYYSVVAGWGLSYFFMSLHQSYAGLSAQEVAEVFDLLRSSADITLFWHLLFTVLTVTVVLPGVRHGIEYWSKFMTTGLLVMLLGLGLYSMTLDGFKEAVQFLLYPNYEDFKPSGFLKALGLSFFTLSLGQGIMLTYGSYMRGDEDIPKTGLIIGVMIVCAALLSGLVVFPVVFSFGFAPQGGPGLVFKVLPLLFAKLPGALLISTIFFVLFVFAALTSAIAFVEVVAANFMDLLGWPRRKAVLIVGTACFVAGIPCALSGTHTLFANWDEIYGKNYFDTVNDFVSIWLLPIGGLLIATFTGWALNRDIAREEFTQGTYFKALWRPWLFFIRWIAPLAIVAILLQESGLVNIDALFNR